VLRCELGLTGTKFGCGIGVCGACTVLIDRSGNASGRPVADQACVKRIRDLEHAKIVTIEGLEGDLGHALRTAWIEYDVVQCGYCQSAQLMAAAALLMHTSLPNDGQIDEAMSGIACRCGTFPRIRKAIHRAAELWCLKRQHGSTPDILCRKDSKAPP